MPKKSRSTPDPDPDTKRLNITVSTPLFEVLASWAKAERRQAGNLATYLLEEKIRDEIESGRIPIQKMIEQAIADSQDVELSKLAIAYARSKGLGHSMNVLDVQRLADKLGIPSDRLLQSMEQRHAKNNH